MRTDRQTDRQVCIYQNRDPVLQTENCSTAAAAAAVGYTARESGAPSLVLLFFFFFELIFLLRCICTVSNIYSYL